MSAKERFFQNFDNFENQSAQKAAQIEEIRQGLIQKAKTVVLQWEFEKQFQLNQAKAAAYKVIIPWWQELQNRYPRISRINYQKHIFGPALYEYPHESLQQLELVAKYPHAPIAYNDAAKKIAVDPERPIDELHAFGVNRFWQANIFLVEDHQRLALSFRPIPDPPPTGKWASHHLNSLRRRVEVANFDTLSQTLPHPSIIIGLANTIASGQVWERLATW